ncbi:MAG TPA: agmatinase [Symbiobacteriaceae bacterium]|jgi:agmatinase|nr:agmatinase [Symbiobacteriaceae bacterium]
MGGLNYAGFPHIERLSDFMGASDDYEASRVVLYGIGQDFTTSFRPGTRFGPGRIREASYGIEEFSYHSLASLADKQFFDLGDVSVIFGDAKETLNRAEQVARKIMQDGKLPFMLGGEHLVTLPCVKAAYEKYGNDLILVQFDAHADLREDYLGNPLSHAAVMRRCLDFLPAKNLYQFGIRSGTADEYKLGTEQCNLFPHEVLRPLKEVIHSFGDRPIYFTIDIDVVDPAFAPGTGTPEPGGITSRELIDAVMAFKGKNIVGFDIVEVAPGLDQSDRTVVLGAKLVREAILAFG